MATSFPASALDHFAWPPCAASTPGGTCKKPGWGLGGRCESHVGVTGDPRSRPLVVLGQLRAAFDLDQAVPLGPARVWLVPERVWTPLNEDGDWPRRLRPYPEDEAGPDHPLGGPHRRRWGRVQPECLEPAHGGWPQVVSGEVARRLLRQPGAVARVIATAEYIDGWWLRELLTRGASADEADGVHSRVELRFPEGAGMPAAELNRMIAHRRRWYLRDIELGRACWT